MSEEGSFFPNIPGYRGSTSIPNGSKRRFFNIQNGLPYLKSDSQEFPSSPYDRSISNLGCSQLMKKKSPFENTNSILTFVALFQNNSLFDSDRKTKRCNIFFFPQNETISIVEKPITKCGTQQASKTLVKRSLLSKESSGEPFQIGDLIVGGTITVYGRKYHLVDCDAFTRDFYLELGISQPHIDYPEVFEIRPNYNPNPGSPLSLLPLSDQTEPSQKLSKLVYILIWDNSHRLFGDHHEYLLIYHLEDHSLEIFSSPKYHATNDHFSRLFKRNHLQKPISSLDFSRSVSRGAPRTPNPNPNPSRDYYRWTDFRIGTEIQVFARNLRIIDADELTRAYVTSEGPAHGLLPLGPAEQSPEPPPIHYEKKVPPYNGFGSEEDSLRSCFGSLQPSAAPQRKLGENRVLSFLASLVSDCVYDQDRRFVVNYYVQDGTIQIREPSQRNSGFVSGQFLSRSAVKCPQSGLTYSENDLFVGATITVSAQQFLLLSAAEDSLFWMESRRLPRSDPQLALSRFSSILRSAALDGSLETLIHSLDNPVPVPPGLCSARSMLMALKHLNVTRDEDISLALHKDQPPFPPFSVSREEGSGIEPLVAQELIAILHATIEHQKSNESLQNIRLFLNLISS